MTLLTQKDGMWSGKESIGQLVESSLGNDSTELVEIGQFGLEKIFNR